MKRTLTCKLSGTDVVQTTTVKDDKDVLQQENTVVLGDRDVVLEQLDASVAEAKRDHDAIMAPSATKPEPSDGSPGVEVTCWLNGNTLYKIETRRNSEGKFQSRQVTPLGARSNVMLNAQERLAEITANRDAVKNAK